MILPPSVDAVIHRAVREPRRPYAVFAFHQPDYEGGSFPVYTVHGGPHDGSSVTAETLRELKVPIVRES